MGIKSVPVLIYITWRCIGTPIQKAVSVQGCEEAAFCSFPCDRVFISYRAILTRFCESRSLEGSAAR